MTIFRCDMLVLLASTVLLMLIGQEVLLFSVERDVVVMLMRVDSFLECLVSRHRCRWSVHCSEFFH